MKGRIIFFIGGALICAFGIIFLINNIIVLRALDPVPFPDDAVFITNWSEKVPLIGEQVFRWGTIVIPCFLIIVGASGIFGLFWLGAFIGIRMATFSILLLASMVAVGRRYLVPFYENLGSWFRFPAHSASWAYWISVMILGACICIYMTGIEGADEDGDDIWTAYVITHALTRALFLLVFLPLCYVTSDLGDLTANTPPLVIYFFIAMFIPIFQRIRSEFNEKMSPVRDILLTFACTVAFIVYLIILMMAKKLFVGIHNFLFYWPIASFIPVLGVIFQAGTSGSVETFYRDSNGNVYRMGGSGLTKMN